MTWDRYFTPSALADALVNWLEIPPPSRVLDLCAGSGNLLRAVSKKWPGATLHANDPLLRDDIVGTDIKDVNRSTLDGLDFAQTAILSNSASFDLVVANPPFGKMKRSYRATDGAAWVRRVAGHGVFRIESAMTLAATQLLSSDAGLLLSIVPDTLIRGSKYTQVRRRIARDFNHIAVKRLDRGAFRSLDLSVSFLALSKSRILPSPDSVSNVDFIGEQSSRNEGDVEILIRRGRLSSTELCGPRGSAPTLHVSGGEQTGAFAERRSAKSRANKAGSDDWVRRGDVLISRVGRNAGRVSTYWGRGPVLYTDCLLRLRVPLGFRRMLWQVERSGELESALKANLRGLSANFITQDDVVAVAAQLLTRGPGCLSSSPPLSRRVT